MNSPQSTAAHKPLSFQTEINYLMVLPKKIFDFAFDRFFGLYVHLSPEHRKLIELGSKTEEELLWSYFLARSLLEYRLSANSTQRQQTLLMINNWLSHNLIPESTRRSARNFILAWGISASEIITVEPIDTFRSKIPTRCNRCAYFCGKSYNHQILVCAIHPFGLNECPDFEAH